MQHFPANRVTTTFNAAYPIFAFSHSLKVVSAVTAAGGIGVWGATRNSPEEIRLGLKQLDDEAQGRPYGVDLVIPANMPERDNRDEIERDIPDGHKAFIAGLREKYGVPEDGLPGMRSRFVRSEQMARDQLQEVLKSEASIVALGVGSPENVVRDLKVANKTVVSLVGTPKHARRAVAAGADILVAQGYDAGAHTGEIGTFSLVPQVVAVAQGRPVIAAGGIATGSQILASFALGAEGAWVGTAWLFSEENETDPLVLKKLIEAKSDDTIRSRADSGKTLRQIKTHWTDEWESSEAPKPLKMPYQDILVGDFLGSVERNQVEPLLKSEAGQSVAFFDRTRPVESIIQDLADGCSSAWRELNTDHAVER